MTAPRETIRALLAKDAQPAETVVSPDPLRRFLRRNLLLVLSAAVFLVFGVLVLVQIDRVYYSREKSKVVDAMIEEGRLFDERSREELAHLSQMILVDMSRAFAPLLASERYREEVRTQIIEKMQAVMDAHPFVWRVRVDDAKGRLSTTLENPFAFEKENTWRNSLYFTDWSDDVKFTRRDGSDVLLTISTDYTTPSGFAEIEELTAKWRARSMMALGLLALLYGVVLWALLLPIRSVVSVLDQGAAPGWQLIAHPRSLLERYYNRLAGDANLSILHTSLRDFIAGRVMLDTRGVLEIAPALVEALFPVPQVQLLVFRRETAEEAWHFEESTDASGRALMRPAEADLVERRLAEGGIKTGRFEFHVAAEPGMAPVRRHAEVVGEEELQVTVVCLGRPGRRGMLDAWWRRLFVRISEELRFGLRLVVEQRRFISQQKSRANVTLSRNLGHDLTNVIATTKLELMNIRAFMGIPEEELRRSPHKGEILRESLEAVLNSTRFLQEVVDLYRSFSYLSRPRFEETDVNALIGEIGGLFRLSTSRKIAVETVGDPSAPRVEVEPRLLRLALFNLLANSADSIKRSGELERGGGRVLLSVRRGRSAREVVLSVEDNGGGIRHPDGSPMRAQETEAIFKLGYTTKESGGGEGLGLDWVQQIVREFHGGRIEARNLEDAEGNVTGALFRITLSSGMASGAANPLAPEGFGSEPQSSSATNIPQKRSIAEAVR
jgi:signal transduction histidine kinase